MTPVPSPKNHPGPHLQGKHLFPHQGQPHWSTGKCTCATTMTSIPTENDCIIQKSASTTATTSTPASLHTKTQWWVDTTNPLTKPVPQATIWCQVTELSLRKDILQAKERAKPKTWVKPPCVSDVAETAIQNITAKITKFPADIARARHMSLIAVHSFLKPHLPQMVRHLTLLVPVDEASEHTHQVCPAIRRSPRTRRDKRGNIHRNPRPSKMKMVPTQHHTRQTEMHSLHHKGNISISTHCPHNMYPSTVRLWSNKTLALLLQSNRRNHVCIFRYPQHGSSH